MLNQSNDLFIENYNSDVTIALGNGADDTVFDFSSGGNIITLGNGDDDSVSGGYGLGPHLGGDIITVGNGNGDGVSDFGTADSDSIDVGNGAGDMVEHDSRVGGSTITLGNGANDIVFDQTTGRDIIQVGHGLGDTVFLTRGLATVTFEGPDALLGLRSLDSNPSFSTPTLPTQTFVSTGNLDVIKGMVAGDSIVLDSVLSSTNSDTLGTATNLAGVANEALLATGTYNAATGTFTESVTGHDVLLTYDTQTAGFDSVVLVGVAHEIAGSTISGGTITLG